MDIGAGPRRPKRGAGPRGPAVVGPRLLSDAEAAAATAKPLCPSLSSVWGAFRELDTDVGAGAPEPAPRGRERAVSVAGTSGVQTPKGGLGAHPPRPETGARPSVRGARSALAPFQKEGTVGEWSRCL